MLLGPVIAPIVGGALSQAFGWRSTFVLLAILAVPTFLLSLFSVPETHHYYVVQNIEKRNRRNQQKFDAKKQTNTHEQIEQIESNPQENQPENTLENNPENVDNKDIEIQEIEMTDSEKAKAYDASVAINISAKIRHVIIDLHEKDTVALPEFVYPWVTLMYIFDLSLTPFYAVQFMSFAVMFTSLTLLPVELAKSPYNLSITMTGLTYIAVGFGMLVGSVVGGGSSDAWGAKYPTVPEARMIDSIWAMVTCIAGAIGYGFAMDQGVHLAAVLISQAILGFGQSVIMTATLSYLTAAKPQNAAGVGSVMLFLCFVIAAVFVTIATTVSDAIGFAYFFILLSGILLIFGIWCTSVIYIKLSNAEIKHDVIQQEESQQTEVESREIAMISLEGNNV